MLSLNRVMLTGRLVRDPELRHTAADVAVCDITLAHNRRFRGNNGELRDEATFIDVTFWRKSAVKLVEFFKKGDPIFVEGRLTMDQWTAKDGQRKQKVKIAASEWRFIQPTHNNASNDNDELADDEEYEYEIVEEEAEA
jgi:single-strand DNA-binding protein